MIQLEFINKSIYEREKIVKRFYDDLVEKADRSRIIELDRWCDVNLDMGMLIRKTYPSNVNSFEKIVCADIQTLMRIKDYIDTHIIFKQPRYENYIINTLYSNKIDRVKFVETLNVKVCPYCNRNFINSSSYKTNCQFDHFINKSKYPIFAASFYNLVPVCPSCNHIKSDEEFSYSPYDNSITTDEMITFGYSIKDIDYIRNSDHIEVLLNLHNNVLDSNVKILQLEKLYQIHADIVQDLIRKKMVYNDNYIEYLEKNFGDIFQNKEEIERIITGAYSNEKNYGRRPLSKMITDISRELHLI